MSALSVTYLLCEARCEQRCEAGCEPRPPTVTAVATSVRRLFGNRAPQGFTAPTGWPADNALLYAFLCCLAIIAVFAPLAIGQYRRISKR